MPTDKTLLNPGMIIDGKWIIIEMIGQGAMGEVYRAHQTNLKRDVAIKIVSNQMLLELKDDNEEIETTFQRFKREVHSMAQVRHPNILNIFDYGAMTQQDRTVDGLEKSLEYIVMEYIPGNTLRFTMSDEGLDDEPLFYREWIKNYFIPVLDGVSEMHTHQIFHRDLKPENIFMDGEIPKIADFGLARSYKMKAVSNSMDMKGTLPYMAPEQFSEFRKADQTADIYSLGKILFEAFSGKLDQKTLPLKEARLNISEHAQTPFLKEIDTIIQKATLEDKNARFQSVEEFKSHLLKALEFETTQPESSTGSAFKASDFFNHNNRWLWLGIAVAILSIAAMTFWHLLGQPGNTLATKRLADQQAPLEPGIDIPGDLKTLKKTEIGKDGSQMILTGTINSENLLMYIDKRKISNYLYVEFLNQVRQELSIENKIVKHEGNIMIYLDASNLDEEQIIYRHDRFHLKDQKKGLLPVTRVTYHGAYKYANFYGRSILTLNEWRFAYRFHKQIYLDSNSAQELLESKPESHMMHTSPEQESTTKDVRVLDNMGLNLREWVKMPKPQANGKPVHNAAVNYDAGLMDIKNIETDSKPASVEKWEGFPYGSFRTKVLIQ